MQVKWGNNLVFRDSFMFLTSMLKLLVQSRRKTNENQFKHFESLMSTCNLGSDLRHLRNNVFPYKYLDTSDNFSDIELPPCEEFYWTLRGD